MATTPSFFSKTIDYKRATACWIACPISTINKAISDNIPSNAVVDTLKLNVEADFGHVLANAYIQYGWGGETSINKHLLNSSGEDTKLTSTDPRWYPENGVDIKGYLNSDKRTLSTANGNYLSFRFYSTNIFLEEYRVTEINLDITYSIPTYTVTWKNHDGTVLETDTGVASGSTPTYNGSTPKKTGYTFSGWKDANGNAVGAISGNTTYTAQFTENKYTIAFNGNGNTGGSMSSMTNIGYDDSKTLTANAFTKTGYTFNGWNTKADGSGKSYADKASVSMLSSANGATVTLYAKWKANSYTIKFNANGGSGSMSDLAMTYDTAKNLTAKSFTRTGYDFLGWSTSSTATTATYADKESVKNLATSGSVTLYAVWKIKTFTIAYEIVGRQNSEVVGWLSDGTMELFTDFTVTYEYGTVLTLRARAEEGYRFVKWADGVTTTTRTVTVTASATYTATFEKLPPEILSAQLLYSDKQVSQSNKVKAGEGFRIIIDVQ